MSECGCKVNETIPAVAETLPTVAETIPAAAEPFAAGIEGSVWSSRTFSLPSTIPQAGSCADGHCIPWLRPARDPLAFRGMYDAAKAIGPIRNSKRVFRLLRDWFAAQEQEVFVGLLLNTQGEALGVSEIVRGARDRVEVPIPDVLRMPLIAGATAIVVIHNHPSGDPRPSDADKDLTKGIAEAFQTIDLVLMDHLIFGAKTYYSFADERAL